MIHIYFGAIFNTWRQECGYTALLVVCLVACSKPLASTTREVDDKGRCHEARDCAPNLLLEIENGA